MGIFFFLLDLNLQQKQRSNFEHPRPLWSEAGSRCPSFTLHVGSYTIHKPINTYDTVATPLCCALKHIFNLVLVVVSLVEDKQSHIEAA